MDITYDSLLKTSQWQNKRMAILERDGNMCRCCKTTNRLQVHHRQYHIKNRTGEFVPPWKYDSKYLITLCDNCHLAGHSQYKVPTFHI